MRAPRRAAAWTALVALSLVAAACSGGAGQSATSAPPSNSTPSFMASSSTAAPPYPSDVLAAGQLPSSRTAALCGSAFAACPAAQMGKPAAQQPTAATVGNFTELDLQAFFNTADGADASVAEGGPDPKYSPKGWSAPGINGTPFPAQYFPSTGNFTVPIHGLDVTFLIPAEGVGVRSTFDLADPVDIPVAPAGQYKAVWLLGNGIGGGAGDVVLMAKYQDGSTASYTFNFTDWCSPQKLVTGEFPALLGPYLLKDKDGKMAQAFAGCGNLYAVAVPIDGKKTLTGLSIPGAVQTLIGGGAGGAKNDFVTAISLQK